MRRCLHNLRPHNKLLRTTGGCTRLQQLRVCQGLFLVCFTNLLNIINNFTGPHKFDIISIFGVRKETMKSCLFLFDLNFLKYPYICIFFYKLRVLVCQQKTRPRIAAITICIAGVRRFFNSFVINPVMQLCGSPEDDRV